MTSKLFIVTGTSGAGKDSVIEGLEKSGLDFVWAKTTTSRSKREGESEGNPYHFVSPEEFQEKIKKDEMLEYANVYGTYYGMEKKNIIDPMNSNKPVFVRIDIQGVPTYKKEYPNSICIFVSAPSFEILEKRIRDRGQDNEKAIQRRMKTAKSEMENAKTSSLYDYIIVNEEGKLDETIAKAAEIIKNETA